jgi:hypothetical protein
MLPDGSGSGLFLSPVPVPPGDPGALSRAAATYTAAHGEIERNHATLTSAVSQAGTAAWLGNGAVSYGAATTILATTYTLTATTLASGATALRAFAADLATAQATAHQANAAVATANAAAGAMLGAQAEADQSQFAAQDAAQTSVTADAHAAASPHSPSAQVTAQTAKTAATDAQTAATAAQGRAATLNAAWESDRARAVALSAQATQQASHAATRAAAGFDAASSGLVGPAQTARGGATGVTGSGGSPWATLLNGIYDGNDKAGWGLNLLGAYSVVLLTKAEVRELEAQAAVGKTWNGFSGAVDDVLAGKGFFSSKYYKAWDSYTGAIADEKTANDGLLEAIRPGSSDASALAKGFGRTGLGLGMASDVITFAHPDDSFGPHDVLGGNTDRVMATANFAASGLALGDSAGLALAGTAMAIPGVDLVVGGVLLGTSAYFAGEFVYTHRAAIGHAVESAGSAIGHDATSLVSSAGHDLDKLTSWL